METEEQAAAAARKTGYPAVLKALGAALGHKTERGLVRVNLRSEEEVRRAFREIRRAADADWEACVVQPHVAGHREFVAGIFRDAQFGACVMFGLGGVLAEALGDVSFRIAPVDRFSARAMLEEIRAAKLLRPFRGEAAVDADRLTDVLTGLSRLALDEPEIAEWDINPLIVLPDGRSSRWIRDRLGPKRFPGLRRCTTASAGRSIACQVYAVRVAVGASHAAAATRHFRCMRAFGYRPPVPVIPSRSIDGIRCYPHWDRCRKVDLVILRSGAGGSRCAWRFASPSGNVNVHILRAGFGNPPGGGEKLQRKSRRSRAKAACSRGSELHGWMFLPGSF